MAVALGSAGAAPALIAAPPASAAGGWGFDLTGRDTSVKPGDDFFGYANGTYLKNLVIPPDRVRFGAFDALRMLSEDRVHAVLEGAAANPSATRRRGDDRRLLQGLHG